MGAQHSFSAAVVNAQKQAVDFERGAVILPP
jgi:hypothetical protein